MTEFGSKALEFTLPIPLKDFIFDLHESTRQSMRLDDVQLCYEIRFKELTDKNFASSPWPDVKVVSPECRGDESFLIFYKEIALRHICTKLKATLNDQIESWSNYVKLFEFILSTSENSEILLTTQWVSDIVQEFVYQFQGFCQFRTVLSSRNQDDLRVLEANRDAWNLPTVMHILKSLVRISSTTESEMHKTFGFFACIELARLECLIGDYTASLKAIEPIFRNEFTDAHTLFTQVPTCHINLYYHAGICYLMLRRYADALETYTEIILHISRLLKPGSVAVRSGSQSQMTKMLEKILSLTAVITALCPGRRVDDQVRELIDAKLGQKLIRLNAGDITAFSEIFDHTCPKFISPVVPDYSVPTNLNTEAFNTQINVFISEAAQQISVLKIRSYLRLYASIDVSKLARFNDVSEAVFISQLVSFKHKTVQEQTSIGQAGPIESGVLGDFLVSTSDVHYYLQGEALIIDTSSSKTDKTRAIERHFISGIRKHNETTVEIKKSFRKYGL